MRQAIFAVLAVALTGCANFDQERFQQGLAAAYAYNQATVQPRVDTMNAMAAQQSELLQMQQRQQQLSMPVATGLTGFLKSQSTNGSLRYCTYSNGIIATLNFSQMCPLSTQ